MTIKTPWNPSRKATQRVKDVIAVPESCCHCCSKVSIANNSRIYGKEYGKWPWVYLCEGCGAYVGMHPFTSIPLGTLATKEIREARKKSKPYFIRLQNNGKISRAEAYKWLAEQLSIEPRYCHFAMFDIVMCEKAKVVCQRLIRGKVNEKR
ncbi:zinc-finger-containing protein [Xenorhabdus sp. PR6a]|uniref:zinc-finger-containing protein n=1 Tax=Xenorhabdus sp. PR6a TaxID=3025877 RepID=UPI00235955B7|nr:zinc-finger-containing protein [Xenorhabdus sp. PR6a]MDC9582768.1 zinc-finger-containing protein [Xenorhabdus sp. PR6a]